MLIVGGCTIPPAFHALETAEVLDAHATSAQVGGGAGGGSVNASLGGVTARVRTGVGDGQEVGVDASALWSGSWFDAGAAARYKRALAPGLAVIAGIGVTAGNEGTTTALGVDVGAIASTHAGERRLRFYGGARLAAAIPVMTADPVRPGGVSTTAFVPVGLTAPVGDGWDLFVEGGALLGWSAERGTRPGDDAVGAIHHDGGYGAAALTFTWR